MSEITLSSATPPAVEERWKAEFSVSDAALSVLSAGILQAAVQQVQAWAGTGRARSLSAQSNA